MLKTAGWLQDPHALIRWACESWLKQLGKDFELRLVGPRPSPCSPALLPHSPPAVLLPPRPAPQYHQRYAGHWIWLVQPLPSSTPLAHSPSLN